MLLPWPKRPKRQRIWQKTLNCKNTTTWLLSTSSNTFVHQQLSQTLGLAMVFSYTNNDPLLALSGWVSVRKRFHFSPNLMTVTGGWRLHHCFGILKINDVFSRSKLMLLHTVLWRHMCMHSAPATKLCPSAFRVEEWLKIQLNTPYTLCTCTGMSWGVTYGLVNVNSRKLSFILDATPPAANSTIPNVVALI